MNTGTKAQITRENVVRLLKDSSKETVSVRLSLECLNALEIELQGIKKSDPEMCKLTLPKFISALVEQYASGIKKAK